MLGQWIWNNSNSAPSSELCGTQGTVSYSASSYHSVHLWGLMVLLQNTLDMHSMRKQVERYIWMLQTQIR